MLVPGETVDQFRITRAIGRGGMGEVFLARDVRLGRRVAIKVLHPLRLGSRDALDRFLAEARITAQFSHPHIVAVYAAGVHRGYPYLALEYLEGQSLRQRLREGRPGVREALRIALAIGDALQEAHRHGVLHRDLKPDNVIIPRDGRLRVVDFGIAKQVTTSADGLTLPLDDVAEPDPAIASAPLEPLVDDAWQDPPGIRTVRPVTGISQLRDDLGRTSEDRPAVTPAADGLRGTATDVTISDSAPEHSWRQPPAVEGLEPERVAGTPRYMAPEQWQGRASTGATDVWALGLILYELLTGRLPYSASSAEALALQVLSPQPVPGLPALAEVPAEFEALILRCLAKEPTARPTAAQVVESLGELLQWRQHGPLLEESPFRGLLPFGERHTAFFYGREPEIATFIERLREQCVLPVVGHSGAGKSSFVQAGVLPRLREQGPWIVLHLRPGERPFHTLASRLLDTDGSRRDTGGTEETRTKDQRQQLNGVRAGAGATAGHGLGLDATALAASLRDAPATLALCLQHIAEREDARVLLLVDQLEELCTLVDDRDTQQRFMQAICSAADDPRAPVRVVFTLRDDFLSRLAIGSEARAALGQVTVLRSPDAAALGEILRRPLRVVGYGYSDPQLVDEMVAAVRGEPACLPLLQFAASTLWERRDRTLRLLTRDTYQEIGGVAGALAEHADGVLAGLPADQLRGARELLLRLVTADGTRRVLPRRRALDGLGGVGEEVLGHLTQARLVSVRRGGRDDEAEPVLELVHESLIRHWARLARWIEESREKISLLADLGQAAERWDKLGRRHDELLRGQALSDARRALEGDGRAIPELVRRYVSAGLELEHRTLRNRRFAVAALAMVAVVAAALAVAFADQRTKVSRRSEELKVQWATAQREGARAALARGDMLEARAKLRMSLESQDSTQGRALWWKLRHDPLVWSRKLETTVTDVTFSPDGRTLAGASQDRTIFLFDVVTQATRILRDFDDQLLSIAFSPDGARLAAGSWSGDIRVVDLGTQQAWLLRGHTDTVWGVAYSPDGKLLASASSDGTVRLWDAVSGDERQRLLGHDAAVEGLAFSPDGRTLASASWDRSVVLWDLTREGAPLLRRLRGHEREVSALSFSPDGGLLASAAYDATLRVWEVASGAQRSILSGHQKAVRDLAFSRDGRQLISCSADGTLRLWDLDTGSLQRTLTSLEAPIISQSLSHDGRWLVTSGEDNTVRLWDLAQQGTLPLDHGHTAQATAVQFSPAGDTLASTGYDKVIRLWDLTTGAQRGILRGHDDTVFGLAFSADGGRLASSSYDKTIRLWDTASGAQLKVLTGHTAMVDGVAFSPDGARLASGGYDETVRLWDLTSGKEWRQLRGHQGWVTGVAFSADGAWLASASFDETVRLWDARSGALRRVLRGHQGEVYSVAFDPSGRWLASGGADQKLRLWDLQAGGSRVLGQHDGRIFRLSFDPAGNRLASASADGTARIWDLRTSSSTTLHGPGGELNGVAFSPDGEFIATTGDNASVQVWLTRSGQPYWRGVAMQARPARFLTHRGWQVLDPSAPAHPLVVSRADQAAARSGVRGELSGDGRSLCLLTQDGAVELWDLRADLLVQRLDAPGVVGLAALPDACAARSDENLWLVEPGQARRLGVHAQVAVASGAGLLVAAEHSVFELDRSGRRLRQLAVDEGVTALMALPAAVAVGYRDGAIELVRFEATGARATFSFEGVPASAVVRLAPGPRDTVIAGFSNGLVGLWSLDTGARFHASRLHGRVSHLLLDNSRLYAGTELGDHLALDLAIFDQDACELLAQVWSATPVIWDRGMAVRAPLPLGHSCVARP